ncbi:RNA polymerase factor sigma-54 [Kaarinaea lacus]
MKQTLQLKLGQSLTMTPQLQQAIRLLQLSSLELQAEIQEILDSNPLLEVTEEGNNDASDSNTAEAASSTDSNGSSVSENRNESSSPDELSDNQLAAEAGDREIDRRSDMEDIPEDLPVDSSWEDTYDNYQPSRATGDDDQRNYEQPSSSGESLAQHLEWQMMMTPFSETDQAIATAIIDSIDHNGYLTTSLEDICDSLNENAELDEEKVELDEVESVLRRVQNFDPPGVGARDIQECMQLQLNASDPCIPWLDEAKTVVNDYFELLGNRDYPLIMRRMRISEEQLQQIIMLIQSLNPRPGSQITDSQPEYIIPDVFVRKIKGIWRVELNPEVTPRLSINSLYAGMAQGSNNSSSDTSFLKNHLQEARWFLKSLKSRNETLLKVAKCIVERQRAFLEYGDEAMKPLVMHDVAEVVDMHESTISRVTTKKYMHTPRGIYELKYFFSSHVSTANGGECSATAIRAMLKKLIAAEEASKPLSDNKLANLLAKQGINVARRTVAKYREAMAIPPSNERKRLM